MTNRPVSWPDTSTNAVRVPCPRPSMTCRKTGACSGNSGLLRSRHAARSPTATRSPAVPARPRRRAVWQSAAAAAASSQTNASRMPIACSRRTRPTAVAVPSGCRGVCWRPIPVFRRPLRRCPRSVSHVQRCPKRAALLVQPPPPRAAASMEATATSNASAGDADTGVVSGRDSIESRPENQAVAERTCGRRGVFRRPRPVVGVEIPLASTDARH